MADMAAGGSASPSAPACSDGSNDPKHHESLLRKTGLKCPQHRLPTPCGYIAPHAALFLLSFRVRCTMVLQLWVPIIVGSAIDQLIHLVQG